jgi:NAD(P)-dependent dehydrogenase (short-subunit alcohol dehydrogenase family)
MAGKTIVVTGAGGGVGHGVVRHILAAGHTVAAVDRSAQDAGGLPVDRWCPFQGDILSAAFMDGVVAATAERFGHVDALLHLAGTYAYAPLAETDLQLWQRLLAVNLTSAYTAARATLGALRTSRGSMTFVGAQAARTAPANQSAYNASKAGVLTFMESLAHELRADGIRVNAIVPDIIDTPANRKNMPNSDFSRWLSAEQVADVSLYLLSDAASAVTGAAITLQRS